VRARDDPGAKPLEPRAATKVEQLVVVHARMIGHGRRRCATITPVRRLLAGVLLVLMAVAACAQPVLVPTATPPPRAEPGGPPLDAAAWAAAMCQARDQLEQAVGDPTTGDRSAAWQEFETQLTGADEERLKAAANGVLGHLTEGSRSAQAATGFVPGSAAATEMQLLLDGLSEGVRTLRDGTLEGSVERVNEGRRLVDAAYEGHYEQALGQMANVDLGAPLPCMPS
jgi:hypothetical protein